MTNQQRQVASYVSRNRILSPYLRQGGPPPLPWLMTMQRQLPPLEQFRRELLEDAEFRALKLGSWLGTTDGKLIAEAVSIVIPPTYTPAYELAVKGLMLAARDQAAEGRKIAGAIALGTVLAGGALALAAGESA